MSKRNVITGATGLLGSHVAERLARRGEAVRALVRPASDTTFLRQLGVELFPGDLHDPDSLRRCVEGADIVYHCAARVGDWGPWSLYQREVIDATRNVLDACRAAGVGRVLHVSSITVYGHPKVRPDLFTEDEPLGQNLWLWDHYCRAKIEAERLAREYGPDVTIVRPSWIYGPRDRNSLPRVFKALRAGRVSLIGTGDNLLNIVHAADVAEGAVRAANHPGARGEAYNLSSEGEITQRELLDTLTDLLGMPRVTRGYPFRMAFAIGFLSEVIGHLIRIRRPPHITRYAVSLIGRPTRFSTAKAREQLGWRPQVPVREGLRQALEWYLGKEREALAAAS
ncbi:MAG TPA: NAD-dependent epimerase/dehydratase family protein [Gemmataceae bacterium]|nr:NAD-dependent epimerase/dehydratase family protein [Gemmataceae bacterium]